MAIYYNKLEITISKIKQYFNLYISYYLTNNKLLFEELSQKVYSFTTTTSQTIRSKSLDTISISFNNKAYFGYKIFCVLQNII